MADRHTITLAGGLYKSHGDTLKRMLHHTQALRIYKSPEYGMIQVYSVSDIISFLFGHNPRGIFCHSTHTPEYKLHYGER